jgi:hypothetical protein
MAAGGSSLMANWIIVALLLLVSEAARRPAVVGPMTDANPGVGQAKDADRDPLPARTGDTGQQLRTHPEVNSQ